MARQEEQLGQPSHCLIVTGAIAPAAFCETRKRRADIAFSGVCVCVFNDVSQLRISDTYFYRFSTEYTKNV